MSVRTTEISTGEIRQLDFSALAAGTDGDGGIGLFGRGEVRKAAPLKRRRAQKQALLPGTIKQATLEELFAAPVTLEAVERKLEMSCGAYYTCR